MAKAIRGNSPPYTLFAWDPGILVRPGKYNVRAQYPTCELANQVNLAPTKEKYTQYQTCQTCQST